MTTTALCKHGGYCVRALGHAGACTATPSPRTLEEAVTLFALDFPTPPWADLRDA